MHRIDGPGATPGNMFTEGDPNTGVPATDVTDDWANAVQEEIIGVLTAAGITPDKPDNTQLAEAIAVLLERTTPPGTVAAFDGLVAPTGWLMLEGQTVSKTTYAKLYAVVGDRYATGGEPAGTFRLNDLRGVFVRGMDAGRGIDTDRVLGSLQQPQIEQHSHSITLMEPDDGGGNFVAADLGGDPMGSTTTGSTGGSETRPVNVALRYMIKT